MAQVARSQKVPHDIPDKLYFKIGEVAQIVGVKPYVLRYWETEFPEIAPGKSKTKQRLYKRKELELVLKIRDLLYKEKFTIEGARQYLKDPQRRTKDKPKAQQITLPLSSKGPSKELLKALKKKLLELEKILED
jgi:DNA-binding transcriptional MerR regulator